MVQLREGLPAEDALPIIRPGVRTPPKQQGIVASRNALEVCAADAVNIVLENLSDGGSGPGGTADNIDLYDDQARTLEFIPRGD